MTKKYSLISLHSMQPRFKNITMLTIFRCRGRGRIRSPNSRRTPNSLFENRRFCTESRGFLLRQLSYGTENVQPKRNHFVTITTTAPSLNICSSFLRENADTLQLYTRRGQNRVTGKTHFRSRGQNMSAFAISRPIATTASLCNDAHRRRLLILSTGVQL